MPFSTTSSRGILLVMSVSSPVILPSARNLITSAWSLLQPITPIEQGRII